LIPPVYFAAYGLPRPEAEFRFSPPRRFRFDFCWRSFGVALEVEGGAWTHGRHTRGAGFIADIEKYNLAAIEGWLLVRVTPTQIKSGKAATIARQALEARGWTAAALPQKGIR
jgi:hypothetical protein